MILICYDGSADSDAAIAHAAALLAGRPATVLTVWETFSDIMVRSGGGFGFASYPEDLTGIDESAETSARERAEHGAGLARGAGLEAQPRTCARDTSLAETILSEADQVDAEVIVVGSRGLTGAKSLLLGSVSHALLQHADRSVLVVPSPQVAAERAKHRHAHD